MEHIIRPVAILHSDFRDKFGIPRQSRMVSSESMLVFEPEYRNPDCFRGITVYSHLWLIWQFSANTGAGWSPTVRPPRLGGNERLGVFASRSPFRPNSLGLSSVRLTEYAVHPGLGPVLYVEGADLMDQTPVFDIKPYLKRGDSIPEARGELSGTRSLLEVRCQPDLLGMIPEEKRQPLLDCLSLDPRPAYHKDPERIYGMRYADFDVHFRIDSGVLYVTDITPLP